MRNRNLIVNRLDFPLLIAVMLLMTIGLISVYSVSFNPNSPSLFDFGEKYGKQFVWLVLSLFSGLLILLIDSDIFRKYAENIYVFCLLMLIIVLFMPPVHGARAWLGIGTLGIQPAEFAKIGTAILLAKRIDQIDAKPFSELAIYEILLIFCTPCVLIGLQPDAGTLVVFSSYLLVMYREGISFDLIILRFLNNFRSLKFSSTWLGTHFIPFLFFILILAIFSLYMSNFSYSFWGLTFNGTLLLCIFISFVALLSLWIILVLVLPRIRKAMLIVLISTYAFSIFLVTSISFVFKHVAAPHQKNRIELVLGLKEDPNGADYNRNRAMAAVGSGGLYGKGFLQSSISSVRSNHVPESETDFIFCAFAEEWGFIGSFVLILIFLFIILRVYLIAERQRSVFFRTYAYCVGTILLFHVGLNIGMNIGLAPVIGIPLPFMSYGGSSLLSFTALIFILLKLDSQRKDVLR